LDITLKHKNEQVGLCQTKKFLHSKRENEKATYGMKECLQIIYLKKGLYLKNIRNSYNSIAKLINNPTKTEQRTWMNIFPRHTNGQQVYKKEPNITNQQGDANQNQNELTPHTC